MKRSVYLSSLLALCCTLFAISSRAQAPAVTTHPVTETICAADTAWFHVAASGATPLSFQWEFSTDGGATWDTTEDGAVYHGTFDDTLRVIGSAAMTGTHYRVLIFNTDGSDTSDLATLNVHVPAGAITGSSSVCRTGTIALANAAGGGTWSTAHPTVSTITSSGVVTGVDFGLDTVTYNVTNVCGSYTVTATVRVDTTMIVSPIAGPTAVCVGNSITLTNTNVIGTHMWNVGVTGRSIISAAGVLTGVSGGLDTVMYSITNACNTVNSAMLVNIETLPAAGTISGSTAVCAGSWITLTSSVGGGVWLSGTPSVAVVSSVGNVTGIGYGTSVISYYQSNSCGAAIATWPVAVDIAVPAIMGNDSVGIDSTLALSNMVSGGVWSSLDETIASVGSTSGIVTGHLAGVTTIRYAVTNACGTSTITTPMHVGPLPDAGTISGPDTICVGATATYTSSVVGGTWTSKNDTNVTIDLNTGVATGNRSRRDTLYYYYTNAFGRSRISKPIFVNQAPVFELIAPASVALGGYYSLTVTPTSALGGTFSTNNASMTPLIGYGFFVVMGTGTSIFTYTRTNGCGTTTKTDTVTLAIPGEVKSAGLGYASMKVFPNPTQGRLVVDLNTNTNELVTVVLTNVAGQKVQEYVVPANKETEISINQPAGVYMLTAVTQDGNRHTATVTVTH
jgi:hypothetical protein